VESDKFGQFPFLYAIKGWDKWIIIDTGCGTADFAGFFCSSLNSENLPFFVICSHVHFDHVGGNYQFADLPNCMGICMGSNARKFTENYEINSLAMAHSTTAKKFTVNKWLQDGELIYLDDKNQTKEKSLEVIFTPGHTPDSIALFSYIEHRMFIGDTFYPFTAVHLDCIGSSLSEYMETLKKLSNFIKKIKNEIPYPKNIPDIQDKDIKSSFNAGINQVSQKKVHSELSENFLTLLSLDRNSISFDAEQLLILCNNSLEEAVNFYLSAPEDVKSLCPVQSESKSNLPISQLNVRESSYPEHNDIVISCGHVEANLNWKNIQQLIDILDVIVAGALPPVMLDGDYGEFSAENFTLLISMKQLKVFQDKKNQL